MAITFSKQALYAWKWSRHSHQIQVNNKAKHAGSLNTAPVSWRHAGYQPGLCRGPTPPCRGVDPMPSVKGIVGQPGIPIEGHDEHDHEEDECKIITRYKNLRFHAMSSKHGPGYPYKKVMQEQTQNMVFVPSFRIKTRLSSRTHENHFLFPKPTSNRCVICKTDSIMQCS